jgi:hypothetical protein
MLHLAIVFTEPSGLDIVLPPMGSDAGVLGAIMLALEYLFIVENDLLFPF